eukprot:6494454-Pyramimonas_sp.AAC.1
MGSDAAPADFNYCSRLEDALWKSPRHGKLPAGGSNAQPRLGIPSAGVERNGCDIVHSETYSVSRLPAKSGARQGSHQTTTWTTTGGWRGCA